MTTRKVGIFAGTFDPIHEGHIAFALEAAHQANLDTVAILPEPTPRRKVGVSSTDTRLAAIRQRTVDEPRLEAIQLDQPQFTIRQTIPAMKKLYPGANFFLLIGSDIVPNLHYWPHFESIRQTTRLIVGLRAKDDESSVAAYLDALDASYTIITAAHNDVSSTQKKGA